MKQIVQTVRAYVMPLMALVGAVGAGLVLLLRVMLTPRLRSGNTGQFTYNTAALVVAGLTLLLMAALMLLARKGQEDIRIRPTLSTALLTAFSGGVLGLSSLWELIAFLAFGRLPQPEATVTTAFLVVSVLMMVCGIAGGGVLLFQGLGTLSKSGHGQNAQAVLSLLPVLWIWFRLARYEMSYVSAVNPTSSYFVFAMLIFTLLFLFKLARMMTGIGSARPAVVLFYAMGTVMFSLGGGLFRIAMLLLGETAAAQASLVSFSDGVFGLLALSVGWSVATGSPVISGNNQA